MDGAAGIDGVAPAVALAVGVVVDEVVDELLHAAAVNAIGTRAAAVQAKRIILATGAYSFTSFIKCTLARALASSPAGAGELRTVGAADRNRDVLAEPASDVVGGFLPRRILEHLLRRAVLH